MLKKIALLSLGLFLIISCSSSSDGTDEPIDNFDRTALLTNLADNIIIPALLDFQSEISALDVARANFVNDINQNNLDALSGAWLEAYTSWQNIEMFNLGIAETLSADANDGFIVFFNRFPVTVSDIETGASTGNYDLTSTNFYDAQGFPALDFLIHGTATGDTNAIDKFTTNANADGYVDYMTDVFSLMNSTINIVVSDWQGTYRNTFVSNTESSTSGSLDIIINDFIRYYEKGLRANKIGTPAGNFSEGETFPDKVEGFYKNDVSKQLALEGLGSVQRFFNGNAFSNNTSGFGLADYLDAVERTDLKNEINAQFQVAKESIESLNNSFSEQITADNTQMTQAYDELQRAVVLLKIDMASALNVDIVFFDNDGD
ncbi:hypothetical protein BTO05_13600 [Winogradskyella sp. PC-19]|uniref:imelysin family protein n=1 Tax=unclassified Winogradskyella TaxID=2615021 RepID=UPI000B3C4E2E|nr:MULTISPECIES: imelysin family protein [unclassified Winogradskyella]ARV10618.1 hypothetical protein BTO05_13600 [Winogradskyella sp. PC-19]